MGNALNIQLVISASQLSDVGIDQIDRKDIPLIKHLDSFCTTMTQIVDEGFSAFEKAHGNMETIQLAMERVSTDVQDCMEHIRKSKPVGKDVKKICAHAWRE
jgi:hypothetical protein